MERDGGKRRVSSLSEKKSVSRLPDEIWLNILARVDARTVQTLRLFPDDIGRLARDRRSLPYDNLGFQTATIPARRAVEDPDDEDSDDELEPMNTVVVVEPGDGDRWWSSVMVARVYHGVLEDLSPTVEREIPIDGDGIRVAGAFDGLLLFCRNNRPQMILVNPLLRSGWFLPDPPRAIPDTLSSVMFCGGDVGGEAVVGDVFAVVLMVVKNHLSVQSFSMRRRRWWSLSDVPVPFDGAPIIGPNTHHKGVCYWALGPITAGVDLFSGSDTDVYYTHLFSFNTSNNRGSFTQLPPPYERGSVRFPMIYDDTPCLVEITPDLLTVYDLFGSTNLLHKTDISNEIYHSFSSWISHVFFLPSDLREDVLISLKSGEGFCFNLSELDADVGFLGWGCFFIEGFMETLIPPSAPFRPS